MVSIKKGTGGEYLMYKEELKILEQELQNTTSEYRKRDLRKRLHRLKKQLNQYDFYRGY